MSARWVSPTGFLRNRAHQDRPYEKVEKRLKNWKEFVHGPLPPAS